MMIDFFKGGGNHRGSNTGLLCDLKRRGDSFESG